MTDDTGNRIEDTLSHRLAQVARAHRQRAQEALSEVGLHVGQEMIFNQLWQQDGVSISDIVDHVCVQPATVTKMLNRMEKSGWVERRPDPDDGRSRRVYLTTAGRALQSQAQLAWARLDAETTAPLTPDEAYTLDTLLTKLLVAFQQPSADAPCPPPPEACD